MAVGRLTSQLAERTHERDEAVRMREEHEVRAVAQLDAALTAAITAGASRPEASAGRWLINVVGAVHAQMIVAKVLVHGAQKRTR
jgi:hypothetical protein|eukprot:COSAG01_NODE_1397_length_10467_cov_9.010706_5_plen_85_part_00